VYTVVTGDTLGAIAAYYGVDVDELAAFNELADPNVIYVGEELLIPANP
jgi:spore germination protein